MTSSITRLAAVPAALSQEAQALRDLAERVLKQAAGRAQQCEVGISVEQGLNVNVRLGEVESIEHTRDRSLSLTVYKDGRKGSASSSDFSERALSATLAQALAIAEHTEPDPHNGLADADRMATEFRELDSWHPHSLSSEQAIELAQRCEAAGLALDPRLDNSEGASVNAGSSYSLYANSHGFAGFEAGTSYSISAALLASSGDSMERDYSYDAARAWSDLRSAEAIGREAGERTLARLQPRQISTRQAKVLYSAELARGLIGHLCGAIAGGAQYRKSSFLLGAVGQSVLPNWCQMDEEPFLARAFGSCNFDAEGVAVRAKAMIEQGVLTSYHLGSYSARKLGLQSTGHAGGIHNVRVHANAGGLAELLREMDTGLYVTELMGQGVNGVTGDYSRGAAGFWVERGELCYPVSELTIAGNLREMYRDLIAFGSDLDRRGSILVGPALLSPMTIAGS
jgi:PmbA protein